MSFFMKYGKALAAVLAAGVTVLVSSLTDGHIDAGEGIQISIALATAAGVYLVPNLPGFPGTKTGLAALLAVLNLATGMVVNGHLHLTGAQWVNLGLAALGVLGVSLAPVRSLGGYVMRVPDGYTIMSGSNPPRPDKTIRLPGSE
jgi:hypothetical protein